MGIKALAKRGFYMSSLTTCAKYDMNHRIIGCYYYITLTKDRYAEGGF